MKDSCPKCFSNKMKENREYIPVKMETPDGPRYLTQVIFVTCRRCGWKGKREELVSLKKLSAKKMGKIRSRMKRIV